MSTNKYAQQGFVMVLVTLALGALVIIALWQLRPTVTVNPQARATTPVVAVMPAQFQPYRVVITSQGTVIPRREIDLVAQVAGEVTAVADNFTAGGFFNAEQTLVELDGRDYEYALLNAESGVANSARELALERGLGRQARREWRDLGSQPANDLFLRRPQLQAAKAALTAAEAARQQAQLNLRRTRISAPFAGRVVSTQVDRGQFVPAGSIVGRVYDSALVEVRLPLSNDQLALSGISPRDLTRPDAIDHSESIPISLAANLGGERYQWPARLTGMDAGIDTTTRFIFLRAQVNDPFNTERYPQPLIVGLFVEAKIPGRYVADALRIPEKAIIDNRVFIVAEDQRLQRKSVEPVTREGSDLWVYSREIVAGDKIVVSDPRVLRAGLEVRVE